MCVELSCLALGPSSVEGPASTNALLQPLTPLKAEIKISRRSDDSVPLRNSLLTIQIL